jgi:hypothetical protein
LPSATKTHASEPFLLFSVWLNVPLKLSIAEFL